ncbi:MAG: TIGR02302 family protein [Hyphomicrobiaceae bacterium]|nr:TIGR02302 family protein [Hyphomicrobiaceae bacterium]
MSRPGPERTFERKVLLSKLALLFEQIWPRAWLLLGIAGLFILVSLAGVWPRLSEVPHKIVLGLFGLAFAGAVIALFSVRWPTREQAIRRVESVSGVRHRPASSYEDRLSYGTEDLRTAALWKVHRQRLAQSLARLRVGPPTPRTDRRDPFALRALLLLGVLLLTVVVGDSAADRLWSALRLSPLAKGAEARLDAWVTPPAYTGKPPVMLADGGVSVASMAEARPTGPLEVPDKSMLIVRASGAGMRGLALEFPGEDGARQKLEAPAPSNPADVMELKLEVRTSGTIKAYSSGTQVAAWAFTVTPDHLPKITLTKPPERSPRGSLKVFYKVEDDYGVVSAEARIRRIPPKPDTSSTAWARLPNTGPRLPYERPPLLSLTLPRAYPKLAEGHSLHEIGDHPWAGMKVELTLVARDLAGQVGKSETIEITLPERRFTKPLARAVVEQRRHLVEDSRNRLLVAKALDALTTEPEGFIDDLQVFLGLRSAYWRLKKEETRTTLNSVITQLWHVALRIEDGDLSDAERALRAAQDALQQALRDGASDEEIQRLMQNLREALAQYLDQLQRQAEGQPPMQGLDRSMEMMTQQDIERMLRNLEDMARSGNREMAQQMLSELRDLLDRLQSGRMADPGQSRRFGKMMDEFSDIVGQQQKLLDDTFGRQQGGGQKDGQKDGQRGQKGQGPADEDGSGGLSDRQRELRERLGRLQRGLRELGMQPPGQLGGAEGSMERAERALREGDLGRGADQETRALEQLRQGARDMAQQMLRQMPSRFGMNGSRGELDPMGRPPRTEGPDPGTGVKVPDEIDVQRAREILEELRRRLGETTRPPIELEYLERLLKRF